MLGQRSLQEAVLPVPPPGVCVGFSPPGRGQGNWGHNNPWASLYVVEEEEKETNTVKENTKSQKNYKNEKHKKLYRGKGGRKKKDFSVLLMNLRGFKSKKMSVEKILRKEKPQVIVLNETHLTGKMKLVLEPYQTWTKNREGKGGGGIATAVAPAFKDSAMGAGEGEQGDEWMVTRLDSFSPALNILNCYGEQRKCRNEEIEEKWCKLRKEMETIKARGEFCLLVGDLNKLVGSDELGVPGNHPEVSPGGRLLRELLATGDWTLVNSLVEEVVVGGPFTRVDPSGGQSCLDLMVVCSGLRPYVKEMIIDSNKQITPSRIKKYKGKQEVVFSDHFGVMIKFENLPKRKVAEENKTVWNLKKDKGWDKYKELTEKYSDTLMKVVDDENKTIEEKMEVFDKIDTKIKFKAFGKTTIGGRNKNKKVDENKLETDLEEQERKTKEEIDEIVKLKTGRCNKVWEIRKRVVGKTKNKNENSAVINPETGKLAVTRSEIKAVALRHCKETLQNNEPEVGFIEHIEKKKKEVAELMKMKDGDFSTNIETFDKMINKFKRSGKRSYDFLIKSSDSFKKTVFKFSMLMFEEEQFPKKFQNTTLHMLYKGKGRKENLSDNRFIHCKEWFARAAEGLVVEDGLKRCLVDGSSIYQVGGQPGHRPEEVIFSLKSLVARQRQQSKMVVIQFYDVQKFFDKEQMEDAVLTCIKRGADPKAVRLWFKLNQDTRIQVRTPAGMSEYASVGPVVGQGTIGGALVSQAVLDDGVMEHFPPGGSPSLEYGSVPLAPLQWVDDVLQASQGLEEARETNRRVNIMMKQRGLNLHKGKSVCLIIGSKKQKAQASRELEEQPMMCGDFATEESDCEKWLGQQLSARGLADSVAKTIEKREGKIKAACREIANIVNDWRSRAVGGMEAALQLWEACCVPSLLHGAGTWVEMSTASEARLNKLQNWFVRLILQVGPGAPLAGLSWDARLLDMGLRVAREKLMLMLHIRRLDERTLANRIYKEQREKGWPGLAEETQVICEQLGIDSVHTTGLDVKGFRKVVTDACHAVNEKHLREKASGNKKTQRIEKEFYIKKEYLQKKKIENVRIQFRARYGMLPFAGNFGHDRKFSHTEWLCSCREEREEESHLLSGTCRVYGSIRRKYGELDEDEDLISFFNEVLEKREELEDARGLEDEARGLEDEARGMEEQALVVEQITIDDASSGDIPGHASLGT